MFSSSIRTEYLQPSKDVKNNQIEFKIPSGKVLMAAPRLVDLGGVASGNTNIAHSTLAGIMSVVERIAVYSGANEIESIGQVPQLMAFLVANNSIDKALSEVNATHGSKVGVVVDIAGTMHRTPIAEGTRIKAAVDADCGLSMVSLARLSGFLSSGMISTEKHPDLRIVLYLNKGTYTSTPANYVENLRPVLAVDMTADPDVLKEANAQASKQFKTFEYDRQYLPVITADATQRVRMNNFTNKMVERFVIQTEATGAVVSGVAALPDDILGSMRLHGSKFQVYLNNDNLYPDSGVSEALKDAITADAWGPVIKCPADNVSSGIHADVAAKADADIKPLRDYCGGDIMNKVHSLEVEVSRKFNNAANAAATRDNQAVYLNCFGEVLKSVVYSPSGYSVVYN